MPSGLEGGQTRAAAVDTAFHTGGTTDSHARTDAHGKLPANVVSYKGFGDLPCYLATEGSEQSVGMSDVELEAVCRKVRDWHPHLR